MKKYLCNSIGKKRFRNLLVPLFVGFLFIQAVNAQTFKVSGIVNSADDGQNIPGVTVVNKTTKAGVVTDLDGKYSIDVSTGNVLEYSFVGKNKQSVTITNQVKINISLSNDVIGLDQVIVVGYGTQKKADLSSAIAVVNAEEIARKPVATFEQALQGITSGVEVTGNRGNPGEGAIIRIRGVGTVNNSNPLIVIDGLPTEGSLSLDPSEIASVQILKDAAAAAIYGARGGNGVVIITTKRGEKGAPQINFEAYHGIQKLPKRLDLLGSEEYSKLVIESNMNGGKPKEIPNVALDPYNTKYNTDWQDALFRTAPMDKYNLSYSGSGKNSNYNISGGYQTQDGIMIATDYKKYHLRINSDIDQNRRYFSFKFGESISMYNSIKHGEVSAGPRSQIESIIKITPTMAIYVNDSLGAAGGFAAPTSDDNHDAANPVAVAWTNNSTENTKGITGNIYGGIEFFKGLVFKSLLGIDYRNEMNTFFLRKPDVGSSAGITKTSLEKSSREISNLVMDNTLSFDKTFGKLFVKSVVGYSEERRTNSYFLAKRQGFFDNTQEMPLSTGDKLTQENQGTLNESALQSYLGRVELGYDGKYLATVNLRNDGSSKFGKQMRHGSFSSWSVAWRASEERFMDAIPIISDLKLRLSGGTLGNQDIGDYKYEAFLNSNLNYIFGAGPNQTLVNGTAPDNFPNELVQWETTRQTDIGLDLGILNNKLYFTGDYYIKNTEDMLVEVPIPTSSGFAKNPLLNTGEVLNRGLELGLSYKEYDGEFHYSVSGNFSTLYNEVISLGNGGEPILAGKVENANAICKTEVGQPIASFYLYQTDGIYHNQAEIDAMNVTDPVTGKTSIFAPKAQPGDIRFIDLDHNGKFTDADRAIVGSPIPKFTYGLTFSADYKGFDASVFFQGVYGNKIYNEMKFWTEGMFGNWNGDSGVLDRYRATDITYTTTTAAGKKVEIFYPANTDTDIPRAIRTDPNKNSQAASNRFLEDGSYLRLKSLSLGYTIPKSLLDKIKISKLRVYVTCENLLTFTKYTGYDPEIGSNAIGDSGGGINIVRGIDNGYYPQSRSILAGIQLTF